MKKSALLFLALIAMALPAMAQNKATSVEVKPETDTPVTQWMDAENKLIDTLNEAGKESFLIMRNKHSVIRSVRIVERDIGAAVKACGKTNPGMKADMNARYKQWQGAVNPILKDADKYLQKEIDQQQVVYPSDFRHVLKLNDQAYDYSESKIKKEVVTSEEACTKLLDSMDRTEDRLVTLLQDILVPENVVRERVGG